VHCDRAARYSPNGRDPQKKGGIVAESLPSANNAAPLPPASNVVEYGRRASSYYNIAQAGLKGTLTPFVANLQQYRNNG
jgi:hypothetical protein